MKNLSLLTILLAVFWVLCFAAQCDASSDSSLAAKSQNPVGDIISIPMENNTYFEVGPAEEWANALLLKPVYPVNLGKLNLINRFIIPFIYIEDQEFNLDFGETSQPVQFDSESGLGNISYQAFFSPAAPGQIIWGLGPVVEFPTHTPDLLGTDKWSAGPALVILSMPKPWVYGILLQNIWSFAGPDDEPDVNKFTFQYFLNYNLANGWYLTSSPVITANWEADDSDNRWTVPFGGGVGRLVRLGKLPVDFKVQAFGYAEKTDFGPDWSLQFQVKFLLPK